MLRGRVGLIIDNKAAFFPHPRWAKEFRRRSVGGNLLLKRVTDYFPPRRRCILRWIHTFGFAGRIVLADGAAMQDLATNRMSVELHSAAL